jgi:hypothetical protein
VDDASKLPEGAESREIDVVDAADLEDVERADRDALGLAFASRAIHDGRELARSGFAIGVEGHERCDAPGPRDVSGKQQR